MRFIPLIIFLFFVTIIHANPIEDAEVQVKKIVKRLHKTNGNFLLGDAPRIVINKERKYGASYNPKLHRLSIDLELYDVCQTFGDKSMDALAFIIGHEMAHCYMEHPFFSEFNNYDKSNGSKIASEKGADIYGLFNAYLAGYESFQLIPEVINKIYDTYNLKDHLKGYPSRQERLTTATEVQAQIEELIDIYEAANFLSAIGEYNLAAASYEYILSYYQGREIYNNLGVNYALEAIYYVDMDFHFYLYPLEIDWNSRIKMPKKSPYEDFDMNLDYKYYNLWKAKTCFERAGKMDPSYITADINIMCVLAFYENYEGVIEYYENMKRSNKFTSYNIKEVEQ